jgi:capsule polysaccharide modification protein KpsS
MENLRLKNWTQLGSMPPTEPFEVEVDTSLTGFPQFVCTRSLYEVRADMKQAVLTVAWTTNDGRARARRYTTYIAKDGINDYFYRRF